MKKKYILVAFALGLSISAKVMAQVPSYVPINGLVGWWPFNGNAIDESGLGTNGIINAATLTSDRFGIINKAYYFNGTNANIDLGINQSINSILNDFSISYWLKSENNGGTIFANYSSQGVPASSQWRINSGISTSGEIGTGYLINPNWQGTSSNPYQISLNQWIHYVFTRSGGNTKIYINGILTASNSLSSGSLLNPTSPAATTKFGYNFPSAGGIDYYKGILDDIGIWNRALTQQEVTVLYNFINCSNNLSITPTSNLLPTSGTAAFNASTTDPNPSYVWQSDFGQGFQTLNNFGAYSGVNTSNLSIANVQLANHLQPIRVIATSGTCIDTSNVATINITDTCIVTINDTITTLISVTDTLIINSTITSLMPPNNINTIKVFPNPTNDHITINYGNFAAMNGYTLKITNAIGQVVFTTPINQQSSYIDLSTWGGNGIYFVQIMDTQNNTIENRKIVLQ